MTDPARENPPLTRREARQTRTGQIPVVPAASEETAREPRPAGAPAADPAPVVPASAAGSVRWDDPALPETVAFDALNAAHEPAQVASSPTAPATLEDLFAPENVVVPKKRRRGLGCLIALLIFAIVAGGITAGGFWVWNSYGGIISEKLGWDGPHDFEEGEATGEALVTISEGDDGSVISNSLYQAGVTLKPDSFYDHLIEIGEDTPTFYPGVYRLQQKMTSAAAWTAITDPANRVENSVALQEGWTVAATLEAAATGLEMPLDELQDAASDPSAFGVDADSLEGWLFPAHYTFDPDTTATQVVQAMVDRTRESLDAAGVAAGDEQRILTIASIVQREGGSADDFRKVSRVILNRLDPAISDTDQKLQMDSTAQFGYRMTHPDAEEQDSAFSTEEQLSDPNPWNTYVHTGLPAGPIANPGDEAIAAAMSPADGDWQYFVTVDFETGETLFAATYAEQQQNEAKLHEWCAAHPGVAGC